MAGTFTTLHFALRAAETKLPGDANLRRARIAYWATVLLSTAAYAMYLVTGEGWVWYQ